MSESIHYQILGNLLISPFICSLYFLFQTATSLSAACPHYHTFQGQRLYLKGNAILLLFHGCLQKMQDLNLRQIFFYCSWHNNQHEHKEFFHESLFLKPVTQYKGALMHAVLPVVCVTANEH